MIAAARSPFRIFSTLRSWALVALAGAALIAPANVHAQADAGSATGAPPPAPGQIVHIAVAPVSLKAGGTGTALVAITIAAPWHINANPPSPSYMIPTTVTVHRTAGVMPGIPAYPAGKSLKVGFDPQPLMVYDEAVSIRVPLRAAREAPNGKQTLKAKLRFQSCNDQVCLAPANVSFDVPIEVTGGAAPGVSPSATTPGTAKTAGAAAGSPSAATEPSPAATAGGAPAVPPISPIPSAGGASPAAPHPVPSSLTGNPLADAIGKGGVLAFLTLFAIGLALNLTPCVYPMIGVTLSIFGARRAAPPIKVFGSALVYVLGMCVMYSSLGLVAALTGGLFGAFLQSKLVLILIGVLLVAMSLSMFGLYELAPPPWLSARLGGAGGTSAIGLFLSGLVVGVFAAPCVGPPVVALLAIVGAKGDAWFGFRAFFVLALGLGSPYLVLGTFSNLLQRLPRSGDWMDWVKKLFGVILVAIGLFYAMLAVAPKQAPWIVPIALVVGGIYLGFIEKSAAARPNFVRLKRITGLASLIAAGWIGLAAPKQTIAFRAYDPALVQAALASGKPVILDFSADWCIPCHELERSTFTDRRVIAAAGGFEVFKVDLTQQDSPEVIQHVKRFRIQGVPTVIFLTPKGSEVEGARFSGFIPPEAFLQRVKLATDASRQG